MNTSPREHGNGHPDYYKSPENLQHEVEETRHRLEDRIDSLSYSLSPGEMLDQALGMARQHGGEFGGNLGRQVKNNPLPLILTSVGVSWLMASSKSPGHFQAESQGNGSALKDKAGSAASKAGAAMDSSREQASRMKGSAKSGVHSAANSLSSGVESSREQLMDFFHDQPVLAASLGVALGASLGAMFPHTESEDAVMGDLSDEAKSRAREEGGRQYEKAREKSQEAMQAAREGDRESSTSQPATGQSASSPSSGYSPGPSNP